MTTSHSRRGDAPALAAGSIRSLKEISDPRNTFRKLQAIPWEFTSETTSYLSHDLHPYPAKFIPQLPAHLIAQLSLPGELVWDPFGGSGTTALEAVLLGRRAISSDANPLATLIARAKVSTLLASEEGGLRSMAMELVQLSGDKAATQALLDRMRPYWESKVPAIPHIEKWFAPSSTSELAYIRHLIVEFGSAVQRDIAAVALSRTVQKVSFQDSETRYASKPRSVEVCETIATYARELVLCVDRVNELGRHVGFRDAKCITLDAMTSIEEQRLTTTELAPGSVDVVVTSPPYPNVTDYHLYHRFRMFWLGYDPREFAKVEIGSHLRHQRECSSFPRYLEEMTRCLVNIALALRPGRYAAFVLGDGIFEGKVHSTAREIGRTAEKLGFQAVGEITRAIHSTKRSFAAPARRAREEKILLLRKENHETKFWLMPPTYRLHDYEKRLRALEVGVQIGNVSEDGDQVLTCIADGLAVERLRRLTFSHAFCAKEIASERTWQAALENGQTQPTKRKESNFWLHGVHPYKGKFYPQLAASLINISGVEPTGLLLDPFCGSGTSVTEGALKGYRSMGCDISPLAVKVARVKTRMLSVGAAVVDHAITQLLAGTARASVTEQVFQEWLDGYSPRAKAELISWFPATALRQFAAIFREIRQIPNADLQELFEVTLSGIVRDVSHQDPKDLRIRRRAEPLDDVDVIGLFRAALAGQSQKLLKFFHVRNAAPTDLGVADIWEGDARSKATFARVPRGEVDLIVTSPPYATALPYIDTYRLSHLVLFGAAASDRRPLEVELTGSREIGIAARNRLDERIENGDFGAIASELACRMVANVYRRNAEADVGFRRKNQAALLFRYFEDMSTALTNVSELLRAGGHAFMVLGNNTTEAGGKDVLVDSIGVMKEIGQAVGWALYREIPISVTTENLKHQRNAITKNSIMWFKKK
jgi:DNA modification methylase